MRRIEGIIFKVSELDTGKQYFVEAETADDLILWYINTRYPTPIKASEITLYGKHIRIPVYTNEYYRYLKKKLKEKELCTQQI